MEPALPLGSDIEPGVNQQAVQVRVSDDFLFDGVSPLGIGVGYLEAQGAGIDELQ